MQLRELLVRNCERCLNQNSKLESWVNYVKCVLHFYIDDTLLYLLLTSVDKTYVDYYNYTHGSILLACLVRKLDKSLSKMIDKYTDSFSVEYIDETGSSALHYACLYKYEWAAIKIIEKFGLKTSNAWNKNNIGRTAIDLAKENSLSKFLEVVEQSRERSVEIKPILTITYKDVTVSSYTEADSHYQELVRMNNADAEYFKNIVKLFVYEKIDF